MLRAFDDVALRLQEMDAASQALDAARVELEAAQSVAGAKVRSGSHRTLLTRASSHARSPRARALASRSGSICSQPVQAEEAGALAQQLQQQLAEAQERISLRNTEVQGLQTELEACFRKFTCCQCAHVSTCRCIVKQHDRDRET